VNLPRARRDGLLSTNLDDEVVVYDPQRKQAHSLNRTAVAVWNHCDGSTPIDELQRMASEEVGHRLDTAAVWLALRKLERANLLIGKITDISPMTRREMLGKAGRIGAAAIATPLIASALVPIAAAAASPPGTNCSPSSPFCQCAITFEGAGQAGHGACVNITTPLISSCHKSSDCPSGRVCVLLDGLAHCYSVCTPVTVTC
jgi:Coenzyme PQQ synthesis protein D (PqqD)